LFRHAESAFVAIQNVTVTNASRFYTASSAQGERIMNKCPVISLQGRQRPKSDPDNSSSLSAMLSDGIGDMPAQTRARVYAFKKPQVQNVTHVLPSMNSSRHGPMTKTDMLSEEP